MQCIQRERGCDDESEQERGAKPVNDSGSCGVESCCCVGNGRVGEPLRRRVSHFSVRWVRSGPSHHTSQLTIMLSSINCTSPNHLLL